MASPASHLWRQSLADDPPQCIRQAHPDLFLFFGFEHTADAVDGLAGIDCVKSAEHQMPGFRRAQSDFDRLAVAHFTDENDFRRLAQRGAQAAREIVKIALSAAETGHLVLSTLHTVDAGQTINRILGMFETEEQEQIRARLADTLRWVISQRLVPRIGGGRYPLLEIMGSNLRTQE